MKMIPVVAGIIWNNNDVLIAQRFLSDSTFPGKWEFPGGKIEPGEHPKEALQRELLEELNLRISDIRVFEVTTDFSPIKNQKLQYILIYYEAVALSRDFLELEVQNAKWVKPGELLSYDLTPADYKIALKLNHLDY